MEITPFAGYRYNQTKITNLADVVAPPYDVIGSDLQDELYGKHPNNVIRLILGKMYPDDNETDNRYTRTAKTLADWKRGDILVQESKPALYVYHQIFTVDSKKIVRKGFMCGCRAVPFGYGQVYPHEITMSGPKLDRLMLTTTCKMNFSQIFGLYPDENNSVQTLLEDAVAAGNYTAFAEAEDLIGVVHQMWVIEDETIHQAVIQAMAPKPIFVADGHHRYETACNYRKQIDDMGLLNSTHPANDVLMVCIAMEDPGLIVMPTHRLFSNTPDTAEALQAALGEYFTTESAGSGTADTVKVWQKIEQTHRQDVIGLYTAKDAKWTLASLTPAGRAKMDEIDTEHHPEWRELGVSILHCLIVDTLFSGPSGTPKYVHTAGEVADGLQTGEYTSAALVMPATVSHIKTLSLLGDRMPAKSTYFYPKLLAGLVFKSLE